jgi:hypothetical protein
MRIGPDGLPPEETVSTSDLSTLMEMELMPLEQLTRLVAGRWEKILSQLDTDVAKDLAKKRVEGGLSIRDELHRQGWRNWRKFKA